MSKKLHIIQRFIEFSGYYLIHYTLLGYGFFLNSGEAKFTDILLLHFFSVQDKHTRPSLVIQQHFLLIFCNSAMLYRTDRDLSGPFVPSQQVYILSCKLAQQTRKWFDSFRHHSRICIMYRYRLKCYVTHSYCDCIYSTFTNFIFVSSISMHRPAQTINSSQKILGILKGRRQYPHQTWISWKRTSWVEWSRSKKF